MSQERLSYLALLSIENELARMIDVFSEQKARESCNALCQGHLWSTAYSRPTMV